MPYYSFSIKIGFTMKEAKKYGRFIFPIKHLKSEIKTACYQVFEGLSSVGFESLHHTTCQLILRELIRDGVFLPNEKGRADLPK